MAVTNSILKQYCDLRKERLEIIARINSTEEQLAKIEEEGAVIDKVRGGVGGVQSFRIEGFPYPEYAKKKILLRKRKIILNNAEAKVMETLNEIEEFLSTIEDSYIRRIITLRFLNGLSWNQVADDIGGGNTEDSVRMAFKRFMEQ
ncbi:MAG: hypothetical protein J6Q48_01265 [Bacteroidaceae bacterium]|nr:hypothetical protein [Bacteroidaceae bacterium]